MIFVLLSCTDLFFFFFSLFSLFLFIFTFLYWTVGRSRFHIPEFKSSGPRSRLHLLPTHLQRRNPRPASRIIAEMRLPWVPSRAISGLRTQLVFPGRYSARSVRSLHSGSHSNNSYDAAVIGGGITGLTTAFRLSQDPTCSKVTLYEKTARVGGWLQSETIPVEDGDGDGDGDGGEVVFEYGPRTLRTALPACLPLLDLVSVWRILVAPCLCR